MTFDQAVIALARRNGFPAPDDATVWDSVDRSGGCHTCSYTCATLEVTFIDVNGRTHRWEREYYDIKSLWNALLNEG